MNGITVRANTKPGATFQDMALAFLEAILRSRSGRCALLKRSLLEKPVNTPREFMNRVEEIGRKLSSIKSNWYDGFYAELLDEDDAVLSWHCQDPHPALAERNGHVTTKIFLRKNNGAWEISVTGRNEKTVMPRIMAAEGGHGEGVAARILAAQNGYPEN